MGHVVRFFPDSDLRGGHDNLGKKALKAGLNLKTLGQGEYVIFVNRVQNKLKMFAGSSDLLAYLKLPKGRLDLRTIALIPSYFDGREIKYEAALRKVLEKSLPFERMKN